MTDNNSNPKLGSYPRANRANRCAVAFLGASWQMLPSLFHTSEAGGLLAVASMGSLFESPHALAQASPDLS